MVVEAVIKAKQSAFKKYKATNLIEDYDLQKQS